MRTRLDNALVVTMNPRREVLVGSVLVEDGHIAAIESAGAPSTECDRRIDLEGHALVPGFVQTHIHGCQTLFRGAADDLLLLDWLKTRIWPLEAAHDGASVRASMRLTALELLLGGTTAMLTMETVRETEHAFDALRDVPIRGVLGKCLMDRGDDVPRGLLETKRSALDSAQELASRYPNVRGARLRACLAPRFALSCSEELLRDVAAIGKDRRVLVHTHGAEQLAEVALVERETKLRNLAYFEYVGLANDRLRLAHAVHLDAHEESLLKRCGGHVLHCPSSNLKLGSGIAPIARYLDLGVPVSLGADGAPCNNNLDGLREARLAALLQKPLFGPRALPALVAFELLTIAGARALDMESEIGSIEVGKSADLVEIDLFGPHCEPCGDVYSRLIYAAERSDIVRVFVAGECVVLRGEPTYCERGAEITKAREQAAALFTRAGLAR